jgi:hypothetical protein
MPLRNIIQWLKMVLSDVLYLWVADFPLCVFPGKSYSIKHILFL